MPRGPLTPRAKLLLPVVLIALVGLSIHRLRIDPREATATPGAGGAQSPAITVGGDTMGTTYKVKLVPRPGVDAAAVRGAVQAALEEVDASMSTYRQDSELSRFNASTSTDPVPISDGLHHVMEVALEVGRASGGALDVTVGPLVDAWGFGPTERREPDAGALSALRARVGLAKLGLDDRGLRKAASDLRVDLSAVAKGHAVDRVARALDRLRVEHYLVEVGGELSARGSRPDGEPWRVAIEKPDEARRAVERVLPLSGSGLATSGDYRNYYEKDGKRRSHLIDPRSGLPIEHGLASVSVVHPRVAVADAWATALSVLGPVAGPEVAEREGLSALFIVRQADGGFRTQVTPAFAAAFPDK